MDEEQKTQTTEGQAQEQTQPKTETSVNENVSFSPISAKSDKSKISMKAIIGVILLIVFIVIGFFIFKGGKTPQEKGEPSPVVRGVTVTTSSPTPTPQPVDKSKIAIEIQNGTGIIGEAAYLRDILKSLGYTNIKVGNASVADKTTTTVTFSTDLSQAVQDEITKELKTLYKEVETKTSSTAKGDILVVTGLKKGATSKPSASPTVKPSLTPSTSPSPTATPTASPTTL